jgi:signal transduction histidine kinase
MTLAFYESQSALLGNSINVAGKNRFLSSDFVNEVKDNAFLKNPDANPINKLKALEENINLLKNGGMLNENKIPKLNIEFYEDWDKVQLNFIKLKTEYLIFIDEEKVNLTYSDIVNLELEKDSFIQSSDNLVVVLGNHVKELSERLIILELLLLILNVAVHIELIIIIISIYKNEFKKNQKIEKLVTIGELSARLSHDMRNPLSNLNMCLKLIDEKNTDEGVRKKIEIMNRSITRLSHQIDNVLDFVRTKEPTLSTWNLNLILQESINQIDVPDTIKISLPEQNLLIKCDKEQFEILFLNLVKNSTESIEGKGFIKIESKETSKEITIQIQDSGSGIPEQYLEQIFDPLVTFKSRGTGLGLASCQNIVKSHGGTISVKNNPTTFTIILPKPHTKEKSGTKTEKT